jgi:hypothetical protein
MRGNLVIIRKNTGAKEITTVRSERWQRRNM